MLIQMVEADLEIRKKDGGKLVGSDELEFGLAPPVVESPISLKPNSTTLSNEGNTSVIALQVMGGPYMWNPEWSSAVQRISQGTPPVGIFRNLWIDLRSASVNNENFAYAAVRRGLHHHLQYRSGYLESQIEEYVKFVATSSTDTNSLDTKKNPKHEHIVTPPNGPWTEYVSGGVTFLDISSTKHKEQPLRVALP
ncbi:endoribonuclease Dicer homolog 3a isoform X1 [Tanacetum coccineum]